MGELTDNRFDFIPIWKTKINTYWDYQLNGADSSCGINYWNMYTDDACTNEYTMAASDGIVKNYLVESDTTPRVYVIALYTNQDYEKSYYVKVRTSGEIESNCKPITFKVNLLCPDILFDYSYPA